jgi:hypothetical protein
VPLGATVGVPGGNLPTAASPVSGINGQRTATDRLVNLSTRGRVEGGENTMVSGFVLLGTQSHTLLIRGVGPSLAAYGVGSPLTDPVLNVRDAAGAGLASNDNWESTDNVAGLREATRTVGAFELTPGSNDAALLVTLPPGSYTVELAGNGGGSGVGLLEVYELP